MAARARVIPAAEGLTPIAVEPPFRRDPALPSQGRGQAFSTAEFRENMGLRGPDEDWRWSIVEAKGIRPAQALSVPDSLQDPLFAVPAAFLPGSNEPQPAPIVPQAPENPQLANRVPASPRAIEFPVETRRAPFLCFNRRQKSRLLPGLGHLLERIGDLISVARSRRVRKTRCRPVTPEVSGCHVDVGIARDRAALELPPVAWSPLIRSVIQAGLPWERPAR